ncbi:MAG: AbrB/MazE/SpoVT family DNA-binding domain-containing protein [Roseateles sp.]|uniref:AbrB/MazE/SpoVT family DNA-binding domain-containing protein n=1 Tax=Roseateles sp. TaxID=1971397 RepID=UPI0039EC6FC3
MKIAKWGNSLAVRLPAAVVEAMGLREGDEIAIEAVGERQLQLAKVPTTDDLLARLRHYRGCLPEGFKFDRLEANARD